MEVDIRIHVKEKGSKQAKKLLIQQYTEDSGADPF